MSSIHVAPYVVLASDAQMKAGALSLTDAGPALRIRLSGLPAVMPICFVAVLRLAREGEVEDRQLALTVNVEDAAGEVVLTSSTLGRLAPRKPTANDEAPGYMHHIFRLLVPLRTAGHYQFVLYIDGELTEAAYLDVVAG